VILSVNTNYKVKHIKIWQHYTKTVNKICTHNIVDDPIFEQKPIEPVGEKIENQFVIS